MFPSEFEFSEHLKSQNKSWIFQPKEFKLKNTTYRADFYCPENNTYYEVVGTRQAISAIKEKIKEFIKTYPEIKFKIVKPNGENYYRTKQRKVIMDKPKTFKYKKTCRLSRCEKPFGTNRKWQDFCESAHQVEYNQTEAKDLRSLFKRLEQLEEEMKQLNKKIGEVLKKAVKDAGR